MELDTAILSRILPSFIRLDGDGRIISVGTLISQLVPDCIGNKALNHFETSEPQANLISSTLDLIEVRKKGAPHIRFRGPCITLGDGSLLALRYSPDDLEAIKKAGLHITDFPMGDPTIENAMLMSLQRNVHKEMDNYVRQLSEEKKRAELLLEYLTNLSSMVSHDFGNFLANISLNLSRLKRLNHKERGSAVPIALIEKSIKEGTALAKSLSELAKKPSPPVAVSPDRFIQANRRLLATALAGKANLKLVMTTGGCTISIDSNQLLRALLNLVLNARDAIEENGEVVITTSITDDGRYRISVSDNGLGIPKELISSVLELGFTTKPYGTGVGLASVKSFCEAFHGTVGIVSSDNVGTTVCLFFPLN